MGAGSLTVDTVPFFDEEENQNVVPENERVIKTLNDGCRQMMVMGMTYEDYWLSPSDPDKFKIYRDVYKEKLEAQNYHAWLQGAYVYEAIGSMVPALQAFSKKPKASPYLDKPYDLGVKEKPKEVIKKEQQTVYQQFSAFAEAFNKQRREKLEVISDDRSKQD